MVVVLGGEEGGGGGSQTDRKTFPSRYAHLHNSVRSRAARPALTWDVNEQEGSFRAPDSRPARPSSRLLLRGGLNKSQAAILCS